MLDRQADDKLASVGDMQCACIVATGRHMHGVKMAKKERFEGKPKGFRYNPTYIDEAKGLESMKT